MSLPYGLEEHILIVCHPQVQQELVVALARCLACIPAQPPAQPNRLQYVTHLLQDLTPTLQQLASGQLHASTQQLEHANAAAERLLQYLRTLMMFMHSWRDFTHSSQPGQSSNAAVGLFISCWPLCDQMLAAQSASLAVREQLAACCTTALRTHMRYCLPVVGVMAQAAAHAVAAAGSDAHIWCQPLCAALELSGQPARHEQLAQLSAAIDIVDRSPVCDMLMERASADQNPELAVVSIRTSLQ